MKMVDIRPTEGFDEYEVNGGPVRVICVDAPGPLPVIAASSKGGLFRRRKNGTYDGEHPIAKQKRQLREICRWENPDGNLDHITIAQQDDLRMIVRATIALCQWKCGVAVKPWHFTAQRNGEFFHNGD